MVAKQVLFVHVPYSQVADCLEITHSRILTLFSFLDISCQHFLSSGSEQPSWFGQTTYYSVIPTNICSVDVD